MRNARLVLVMILAVITAASPASAGDQHVVSPQQLAAAINAQLAQQDSDRAAIHEALARPQVVAIAKKMNIDLARAAAAPPHSTSVCGRYGTSIVATASD